MHPLRLAGIARRRWQFDGELRGFERARDVRLDQRAGPDPKKIGVAEKGHRQSRGSGLAIATEAERAQRGIELRQIMGTEVDVESRSTAGRVSAKRASHFQIACGQVQLEIAKVHAAIALRIGGIDDAAGRCFAGGGLRGGTEGES